MNKLIKLAAFCGVLTNLMNAATPFLAALAKVLHEINALIG